MKDLEPITINRLYRLFSLFFFSNLFLILAIVIPKVLPNISSAIYIAQGLFVLFFFGYTYLLGKICEYYLTTIIVSFKENYPKYKLWYWLSIGIVALIFLIGLGYYLLDRQAFWGIIISTFLVAILGLVGWILKQIYEKYLRKEKDA